MTVPLSFTPLVDSDFATVAALGADIWRAHYVKLIGAPQVEYMLAGRFAPERLAKYLGAKDRWFYILRLEGKAAGYCSYALTERYGELKLEQLYLLPELHGRGLGRFMLQHVEAEAALLGCSTIMLTVNKGNTSAISVYEHTGFVVRESAVFDIGNGFVMDDFVMEKCLG
jgi:diamine N-acetyltransferase